MKIDYLSADGHKWLLGAEGAGIFYCRRELLERTRPLMIGWMNVVDAQNYGDYDYTLRPDAGRFECGSYNVPGILALKASTEFLMQLGVSALSQRLKDLGDRLILGLMLKGYEIISPRNGSQWSGIVSFVSRSTITTTSCERCARSTKSRSPSASAACAPRRTSTTPTRRLIG
jgi:selenocysteine lyase/cysteine desulfurase